MKKLILIFLLSTTLFAQDKVDSIVTAIQNKSTIEKIKILDDFCWVYRDKDPKQALRAGNIALMLAESIDDKHFISKSLNFLSVIYRDQGEYEKSLKLANRGLDVAQQANDFTEIAYSYNNISTIYRLMGNYSDAIEKLYEGLKIFESINDSVGIGYCYYNLGFVYLKQENYNKALEVFQKTVEIRNKINDHEGKTKALGRIAEVYLRMGNDKKALEIFNEVENNFKSFSDQRGLNVIRMGLADIYKRKKDYQKAILEREEALKLSKNFNDISGIVTNLSELANLYTITKNYSLAKKYLDEAKNVSDKFNSSELKITTYKNYVFYFETLNDLNNAYKYLKLLKQHQDLIYEKEKRAAISEVESAYQISKIDKENLLLKTKLEQQKTRTNYIILIAVLFIGLASTLFILYRNNKKTSEKLKELNATKDKFFSIIAHDLKNPITSQFGLTSILIEEFHKMTDAEKLEIIKSIDTASKQTYKLLENLLYWARTQTGKLEFNPKKFDINDIIIDTISLLNESAKSKKIKIEYEEKPQNEVFADEEMIKTVLRNLLSNAVKFTNDFGVIKISLNEKSNNQIISISDDGIGIEQNILDKLFKVDSIFSGRGTRGETGTGLGLILCKEFVERNKGKIWVESLIGKGTTFSFSLPT
ncbi:MAG: tetratricopeptide repeat-containing sensor histidine kinase [Melioribacteraceae bacterium]|nr:tetratricopeptide repeat-containing sensor histidine kinase [Melioribacteraceae bacterium]